MKRIGLLFLLSVIVLTSGCGQNTPKLDAGANINDRSIEIVSSNNSGTRIKKNTVCRFSAIVKEKGVVIYNPMITWEVRGLFCQISQTGNFCADYCGFGTIEAHYQDLCASLEVEVYSYPILDIYNQVKATFLYQVRVPYKNLTGTSLETELLSAFSSPEAFVGSLGDLYSRCIERSKDNTSAVLNPSSFGGIGIYIKDFNGKIAVLFVMPGYPAAKAGLKAGDIIQEVDASSTSGLKVDEVVNLIRGNVGANVSIKMLRGSSPLDFTLTREAIQAKSAYGELIDGKILYLRLPSFGYNAYHDFADAYNSFLSSFEGVIVDVRWNGGGYLNTVVDITSSFVPSGKTLFWLQKAFGSHRYDSSAGIKINLPTVVLMNKDSASASEILASALTENSVARGIGEKTYGKGTVQERSYIDIYNLYLTIAEYFSPSSKTINGIGITPDVPVAMSDADFFAGNDTQFNAAITELKSMIALAPGIHPVSLSGRAGGMSVMQKNIVDPVFDKVM